MAQLCYFRVNTESELLLFGVLREMLKTLAHGGMRTPQHVYLSLSPQDTYLPEAYLEFCIFVNSLWGW